MTSALRVRRLCSTVPAILAGVPSLRVHSAFRHACNLVDDHGRWLTLQTRAMPLAPRGLIVETDVLDAFFTAGQAVRPGAGGLFRGPGATLDLCGAETCSTRLDASPDAAGWLVLGELLPPFLRRDPPPQGLWHALAEPRRKENARLTAALATLSRWLRRGTGDPADAVQALLGYGAGLTPSGDDFLVGVLLTLAARGHERHDALRDTLLPRLKRTTDFGAALLASACDGLYDESLRRLMAIPADLPDALARVAAHGHSSGHDMLCGIAWALPRSTPATHRALRG